MKFGEENNALFTNSQFTIHKSQVTKSQIHKSQSVRDSSSSKLGSNNGGGMKGSQLIRLARFPENKVPCAYICNTVYIHSHTMYTPMQLCECAADRKIQFLVIMQFINSLIG